MVGGGKIKNKDQLSLAEARVEAELGNSARTISDYIIIDILMLSAKAFIYLGGHTCRKQCSRDCERSAAPVHPSTLLCMILQ